MNRSVQWVLALLLLLVAPGPAIAVTFQVGATSAPKVAIIVGPAGAATDGYRALAEEAAVVADAYTPNVVRVYSPNATWPAVRAAIDGASLVVYLGHGNGWPSRYRDALYPPTQNGFGLNPVAGGDDYAHQYFGEQSLDAVRLAPNAIVLLHHLCYASGNSEPGLPEGTLDVAVQRVDNYAAGFIRAGARAVVAEAQLGPAPYLRALLGDGQTIAGAWAASPQAHGNVQTFASARSAGYEVRLDPDEPGKGFHRSLVTRGDGRVEAGIVSALGAAGVVPTLATTDLALRTPRLAAPPVGGASTSLLIPLDGVDMEVVPRGLQIGIHWTRLDPPAPAPGASSDPPASLASDPPAIVSVVAEQAAEVVEPVVARRGRGRLVVAATIPDVPGRYRLSATLHDASGVAYDAATQALVSAVLVEVAAPLSVEYAVQPFLAAEAASDITLTVRVRNSGSTSWPARLGSRPVLHGPDPERTVERTAPARLVGRWISPTGVEVPVGGEAVLPIGSSLAGEESLVTLALRAPSAPGPYLLLLDVITPEHGSLAAAGSDPALVRVTVEG